MRRGLQLFPLGDSRFGFGDKEKKVQLRAKKALGFKTVMVRICSSVTPS